MNLLAHANNMYTSKEFQKMIFEDDRLLGFSLDIIMTKDNRIIIFCVAKNNQISVNAIESATLMELDELQIRELDSVLEFFNKEKYAKKMFFHLIPINRGPVDETTLPSIRKQNYQYVKLVADIAKKYPDLNLHFSSLDYNLVYFMKELIKTHKVGVTLSNNNLNYVDVNFYEFPTNMLDFKIMNQQLNLDKDVIITVQDDNDLALLVKSFRTKRTAFTDQLFDKIMFDASHPEIFYLTFRE